MKKLLTLLFTFALAFSLVMPVFAQDQPAGDTAAPKAEKKEKKAKKAKKSKKEKKEAKTDEMK